MQRKKEISVKRRVTSTFTGIQRISKSVLFLFLLALLFITRVSAQQSNQFQSEQNPFRQSSQNNKDDTFRYPQLFINDLHDGSLRYDNSYTDFIFLTVQDSPFQTIAGIDYASAQFFQFLFIPTSQYAWVTLNISVYHLQDRSQIVQCRMKPGMPLGQCRINKQKVDRNQKLLIKVQAEYEKQDFQGLGQVKYQFRANWQVVSQIQVNNQYELDFTNMTVSPQYHVTIPNQDFTELRITLIPETHQENYDNVKIFGRFGAEMQPTDSFHDFQSIHLWNGGQGIFLMKRQFNQTKKISLLIEAVTKTVYKLNIEMIKGISHQIDLNQILYEHLMPNSVRIYHVVLPKILNASKQSDYIISVLQQAGSLMIQNYKDQSLTQKFEKQPYSYKKDSKILITSDQQQKLQEFYMRVQSSDHDSIFMVNFNQREKQSALKLTQDVAQNIEVKTDQIVYVEYQKYFETSEQASSINIEILKVFGKIDVQFRICNPKTVISMCLNVNTYKDSSSAVQHYDSSFVGLKNFYKFNISDDKMVTDVQHHQKLGYLLVCLKNKNQNPKTNPSMAMVEYKHNAKVESIRQGKPITDIVSNRQERFYKYVNTQPQISEIRFHLVQISGQSDMDGFRKDPREETLVQIVDREKELQKINASEAARMNPLVFNQDLDKPIYIRITGRSQAVFGLSVQLRHNTEQFISTITLEEEVKFKVEIKPGSSEVFAAHALFGSLYFSYKASGIVMVCILNNLNACENGLPQINSDGNIDKKNVKSPQQRIRITNPSEKKIVEVQVQFRSEDYNKCQVMKTGQLVHKVIKNGECLQYGLDVFGQDLQVFNERVDFGQLHAFYRICGNNYTVASTKRKFIIDKKQIQQLCKDRKDTDRNMIVALSSAVNTEKTIKIESLIQYKNKIMTLPDGIAYRTQATTYEDATGLFFYDFLNKIDTRIILRSIRGKMLFYVNVYEKNKRFNTSRKIVSKTEFDYMPQSPQYVQDQYLLLKASELQKCKGKCSMDIAVYSKETVGTEVQYSIQVVQNYRKLRDHISVSMHLLKDSASFYQYHFSEAHQNSSIIIELSDDNMQCASTYVSQNDVPSEQNNIGKSEGNKLVLADNKFTDQNRKQKTYYIGVYAKEDCAYTLTVYSTKFQIVMLERGKSHDMSLAKGQVKFFMFEHLSDVGFKIVSISEFGKVRIYADKLSQKRQDSKVAQSDYMMALQQNKTIEHQKFALKGNQLNLLAVNNKDKGFCSNCYYILAVQATEKTRTSIMLADKETSVHLTPRKQFYDEMKGKDQTSNLQLIMVKAGKLEIVVFYGTLQFTVKDSSQQQKSEPFKHKNAVQYFDFDFSKNSLKFWQPLKIQAKCITDSCAYSLKIQLVNNTPKKIQKNSEGKQVELDFNQHVITKGHPTFLSIGKNKVECFTSFIKSKDEQFIISGNRRMVQPLSELDFSVKIGDQQNVPITKTVIRNVLSITFKPINQIKEMKAIDFCVKLPSAKFFSGMIEHADEETSLLPTDTEISVQRQKIFTIYPQGSFIMDVFQCQGDAVILQGRSEQLLVADRSTMSALNNLGMPGQPHAIKMSGYSTTLIKISSPLALVRWFPINQKRKRGLGYVQYKVGDIEYDTVGQWITVDFDTLKIDKQASQEYLQGTEVDSLSYYLYVSNNSEHLKSAVQCQRYRKNDVIALDLSTVMEKDQLVNGKGHVAIPKSEILSFFSENDNIFFSISGSLRLKIKDNNTQQINIDQSYEDYKFIYPSKQIPSEIWKNLEKQNMNIILMIALIVSGVVGLFVFTLILVKCLIPMISRIRNNNLIEQKPDPKDGSEIIPPSSERNRVKDRRVTDDLVISQRQKGTN